ncbi:MAG: RluA family pseudouridine synthase [Candidatus Krumholzibacteriales bacterium]
MNDRKRYEFIADEEDAGERIDRYLSDRIPGFSRTRIQKAINAGDVKVDGIPASKPAMILKEEQKITVEISPPTPIRAVPEKIDIDVIYEDRDLLVVNKQAGLVVHPAPGNTSGTLVNALLYHCGDLSGIGGEIRPGIVHRLDKDTSGLLVVAKNDRAHIGLSGQLMKRKVKREYRTIVWGRMKRSEGTISAPIGRSPSNRKKMTVLESGGREAVTYYNVIDTFPPFQYIKVRLGTGRTHQIRVHFSYAGRFVLGDPEYGGRKIRKGSLSPDEIRLAEKALSVIDRQALHAARLAFVHPVKKREMVFSAPLPEDFREVLAIIGGKD